MRRLHRFVCVCNIMTAIVRVCEVCVLYLRRSADHRRVYIRAARSRIVCCVCERYACVFGVRVLGVRAC